MSLTRIFKFQYSTSLKNTNDKVVQETGLVLYDGVHELEKCDRYPAHSSERRPMAAAIHGQRGRGIGKKMQGFLHVLLRYSGPTGHRHT